MTDFISARSQMALSLGFHIIFASISMAMPFFMATSHWFYLKKNQPEYRILTKTWSKGVAIFFAVGAVSGTALSFELGLLWPKFMEFAGPIIGMPFSWEGTAFFLESIFLGIFLYGWDKVSPWIHWLSGVMVGLCGVTSAFFVICANGWMNSPAGFDWNNGNPIHINPWAAMFNDAALIQGIHMVVAGFEAVGFAVVGIHAFLYLKNRFKIHLIALKIAFTFAGIAALIQPLVGDFAARSVAQRQPVKLAAMEGLFETQRRAPFTLGGIPNETKEETSYGIQLPGLLSFLAFHDFQAEVKGLKEVPKEQRPPVLITHFAFQLMVGIGTLLALLSLSGFLIFWKFPRITQLDWPYRVLAICTPLGFLALESGWVVTEVGRQPWIIYGLLRTSEALTPRPGVQYSLALYAILYGVLAIVVTLLMIRQIRELHRDLLKESNSFS